MLEDNTRQNRVRDDRFNSSFYGVIDLGTHNCRMLIAKADPAGRFRIVDAFSRPVRLGEGLSATGRLSNAAMDRAMDALTVCAERLYSLGVVRVRAIATEACRRAENGMDFLKRVRAEAGLRIQAITSEEEATLTLQGCATLFRPDCDRALLFDIGGGSTEVMWVACDPAKPLRLLDMISIPCGVVDFAERFGSGRVAPETYPLMVGEIDRALAGFAADRDIARGMGDQRVQVIGTSGTMTTLAAVHLGLECYDRLRVDGANIAYGDIRDLSGRLAGLDRQSRAVIPCIGVERADLVVAGCAILEAICSRWTVKWLTVADRGIREGMLLGLMSEDGLSPRAENAGPVQEHVI